MSASSPTHPRDRWLTTACALVMPVVLAALGSGCGHADDVPPDTTSTFIAFASDFQGFRGWEAFHLPDAPAQGSFHVAGPRTIYLNLRPPHGSREFPVGTVLVKEVETGPVETRKVFA